MKALNVKNPSDLQDSPALTSRRRWSITSLSIVTLACVLYEHVIPGVQSITTTKQDIWVYWLALTLMLFPWIRSRPLQLAAFGAHVLGGVVFLFLARAWWAQHLPSVVQLVLIHCGVALLPFYSFSRGGHKLMAAIFSLVPTGLGLLGVATLIAGFDLAPGDTFYGASFTQTMVFIALGLGQFLAFGLHRATRLWVELGEHAAESPRIRGRNIVLFIAANVSVIVLFAVTLIKVKNDTLKGAASELRSISDLKAYSIGVWVKERFSDAKSLRGNPWLVALLDPRTTPAARRDLLAATEGFLRNWSDSYGEYRSITFLDRAGGPVLTHPAGADHALTLPADWSQQNPAGGPRLIDLQPRTDGGTGLGLLTPVHAPDGPLVGWILTAIDPAKSLYPMLKAWPVVTATGEFNLVQRDGDQVVFRNSLRFATNHDRNLHLSIENKNLPAAAALLGIATGGVGFDYAGNKVVWAANRIESTPWTLITKFHEAEALQVARNYVIGLTAGLFLVLSAMGTFVGRTVYLRQIDNLRMREQSDRARLTAAERLAATLRQANDAFLLVDEATRILEANDQAKKLYGLDAGNTDELHLKDLCADSAEGVEAFPQELATLPAEGAVFERLNRHRDGRVFPVEVKIRAIEFDHQRCYLLTIRDLTEQKAREQRNAREQRLQRVRSEMHLKALEVTSPQELADTVCRHLVNVEGLLTAWMVVANPEQDRLQPLAAQGAGADLLGKVALALDPALPQGQSPSAFAFREARPVLIADILTDPLYSRLACWKDVAARAGFRAMLLVPVLRAGRPLGVLGVAAGQAGVFSGGYLAEELNGLADELSSDLDLIASRRALAEREELFSTIVNQASDAIALIDAETFRFVEFNRAAHEGLGYTREEFARLDLFALKPDTPAAREQVKAAFARLAEVKGQTISTRHLTKDGRTCDVSVSAQLVHVRGRAYSSVIWRDITAEKRTEAQMKKLSLAVEQSPSSIIITDPTGVIEYVNPSFSKLTGYRPEEIVGQHTRILMSDQNSPALFQEIWQTIGRGETWMGEMRNRSKDGRIIIEQGAIAPVFDQAGRIIHYVSSRQDITAARQQEEELLRSQELYRLVAQNTHDIIWVHDLHCNAFTFVSEGSRRVLGYEPAELVGARISRVLTPACTVKVKTSIAKRVAAVRGGDLSIQSHVALYDLVCKDGRVVRGEITSRIVLDASGHPSQVVGTTRDVDQRERALAQLRESEQQYRELFDLEADAILVWTSDGSIRQANRAATGLFGYSTQELTGLSVYALWSDAEGSQRIMTSLSGPTEKQLKIPSRYIVHKDGRRIPVQLSVQTFTRDGQPMAVGVIRDITEQVAARKKLEQFAAELEQKVAARTAELARQASFLEGINRHAAAAIIATDTTGLVTIFNPEAERMLGYTAGEIVGRATAALWHLPHEVVAHAEFLTAKLGREIAPGFETFVAVAIGGGSETREWTYVRKDGAHVPVLLSVSALRDPVGRIYGYLGIARDITASKAAEQALRNNQQLLADAMAMSKTGAWTYDPDTDRFTFDDNFFRMLRSTAGDQGGHQLSSSEYAGRFVHPDDAGIVGAEIAAAMGQPLAEYHELFHRFLYADGTQGHMLVRYRTECDAAGKLLCIKGVNQDITELRKLEEALQETAGRLQLATSGGGVGIWDFDASNGHLTWNDQMHRLYGTTPEAFSGGYEAWTSGLHPDDRQRCMDEFAAALAGTREYRIEFRVVWPDQSIHHIRAQATLQRNESGQVLRAIGTNWDITAEKELTAQTNAMLEKEREVSEMKSRFISVTSHEFRTPLAAAMGSAELLSTHFERLQPAKRTELLGRIEGSLHRITGMLDEVLTLNRIDSGRVKVDRTLLNLVPLVESCLEEVRMGDRSAHTFAFQTEGDARQLPSDAGLLHHILTNLLSNAVRYSPGGTTITTRLEFTAEAAVVSVEDRGIGIPADDLKRIFEPFERGSNVGTIKGTGLGLNIVHRMAGLLGGTIAVDSTIGQGSRFSLRLPLNPPAPSL